MNLGDYPLSNDDDPLPILSWCGSEQTHDIILPTYELTEATLQMLSRTTLDIFAMRIIRHLPWSKKISKGFFRGRDSCRVMNMVLSIILIYNLTFLRNVLILFVYQKNIQI
jgi:hypothetical protein